ncbi:AI-2E family transporter [Lentzea rhizosphaerae]|uniref:AI-2E family transporter n=1 Tax=Lentzea rhizosphaerae TaxID=2041025 RepID=A0ABV8BLY9_9PSEU
MTDRLRRWSRGGIAALVLLALAYVCWRVAAALAAVLIPLAVAVLLAALLWPAVSWLHRRRVPRALSAGLVLLTSLALLGGMLAFTVDALVSGAGGIGAALRDAVVATRDWLVHGPLSLSEPQIDAAVDNLLSLVTGQTERILGGATATAAAVGTALAGVVLSLFALYFFLYDGDRLWRNAVQIVPESVRERVDQTGRRVFHALSGFTRATLAVAVVDAVAIGAGLAIIGVPMAIPLTSLVFLGAFVPYAGAFVAGCAAVLVALVTGGPVSALLVLALTVAVQELEGDVLQPFLLGRVVRLHPLTVIVAVATGVVLAGVVGALFAVPVVLTAREIWHREDGDHGADRTAESDTARADDARSAVG